VHATFEKYLSLLRTELEVLEKAKSQNTSFNSQEASMQQPSQNSHEGSALTALSSNTQASDEKFAKPSELAERKTGYGLVYIMYMRFVRRAEGVKGSRRVFGLARKDSFTPWQVYEAAALMEYHCSNDNGVGYFRRD